MFDDRSVYLVPGINGLPMNISAMMHPSAHMSTALVYEVDPSKISGARYLPAKDTLNTRFVRQHAVCRKVGRGAIPGCFGWVW